MTETPIGLSGFNLGFNRESDALQRGDPNRVSQRKDLPHLKAVVLGELINSNSNTIRGQYGGSIAPVNPVLGAEILNSAGIETQTRDIDTMGRLVREKMDADEFKAAQKALKESEKLHRDVLANLNEGGVFTGGGYDVGISDY